MMNLRDCDMSLLPIDVGFNLKIHEDMCVELPPGDTLTVAYMDHFGKEKTVTGSRAAVRVTLIGSGYRVQGETV